MKPNKQELLSKIISFYYNEVDQYEKNNDRDHLQATKIQAYYRMFVLHRTYMKNQLATITIQKYCRAYLARKLVKQRLALARNQRNILYYSHLAETIQRYFRGYIFRKYKHDFYLRKKQLEIMKQKNITFLKELQEVSEKEKQEEQIRNEQVAKQEFLKLATNLHHLTSTAAQPGIYKPPFSRENPKAFDIEVETHLKIAFQTNIQWKKKRGGSANPSFKIRPQSQRVK